MQPSVAHGLGRRLGIFPVAGHDVLAADDDLALLAARQFAPLLVEDLQLQGWRILPDEPKRCQWRRGELVEMTGVASERP